MKTSYLIILILLIVTACSNESPDFKQKVLFEKHYTNWAWGYQNQGFLIDSLGYVRGFDIAKKNSNME